MILARKARPRKTVDDFMSLPEGTRAELIDGVLLMSPSPRPEHQDVVGNVFTALREHVRSRRLGRVFVSPLDVHLPSSDIVEPDVLFITQSDLAMVQDWIRGAPALVVEVLSPTGIERDRMVKRDLYARNGVREYWIVDIDARAIEVFSLCGNRLEPNGYFEHNYMLSSVVLPEFRFSVSDAFAC